MNDRELGPKDLGMPVERSSAAAAAADSSASTERDQLESILRECKWNKNAAAEKLGISYKTVANTTSLLKQKLGAKSHSDLIRIAVEIGMN